MGRVNDEPSKKEARRLSEQAETAGCDRCGFRFADFMPYFVCRTAPGKFTIRCSKCRHLGSVLPILTGACIGGGGGDPWSRDDRDWFAAHPTRRWRLRDPGPGELEAMELDGLAPERDIIIKQAAREGARVVVVTFQPEPGKRMRQLAKMSTSDSLDSYTERGIVQLLPAAINASLNSAAALKADDWERFYNETRRIRAETFVKQMKL